MIVTFTLQSQYSDPLYVAGPFNISGTTSGGVTTQLATGLTKEQLLTGYTINGVDDLTTGGTIASTGVCTNTQPWSTGFVSSTPTPTVTAECWSVTYDNLTLPSDLYARYRDTNQVVQTILISNLETVDNQNGTSTAYICVSLSGAYSSPVFVQGGIEVISSYMWVNSGTPCTSNATCLIAT